MKNNNITEKYELFKDTLDKCGTFLIGLTDEEIEYNLFEEFDTDSISFLHEETLKLLLEAQFIDKMIVDKSLQLSVKFRKLENSEFWNTESVRNSKEWKEILILSDEIKNNLQSH